MSAVQLMGILMLILHIYLCVWAKSSPSQNSVSSRDEEYRMLVQCLFPQKEIGVVRFVFEPYQNVLYVCVGQGIQGAPGIPGLRGKPGPQVSPSLTVKTRNTLNWQNADTVLLI